MATEKNTTLNSSVETVFVPQYSPSTAIGNAVSMFMALPGLRGFWTMGQSFVISGATVYIADSSGQGRHMTKNGGIGIGVNGIVPYIDFVPASSGFLSRADEDALDITGTETHIESGLLGLTLGCWVKIDNLSVANSYGVISKDALVNQRSYSLYFGYTTSKFTLEISGDGSTMSSCAAAGTSAAGQWCFVVGKFVPSTSMTVYVNNTININTTSIPASIYVGTSALYIGSRAGANTMDGKISMAFLCATALPHRIIANLFHHTRALYGV